MFEENYLHDIPWDIQEMIMDISKRRYCDIYIYHFGIITVMRGTALLARE